MSSRHRSPAVRYGGKAQLAAGILPLFPDHKVYVEIFGGAGSLLLLKEPVGVEIYNDLDSGLVNFFAVLRDPDKAARLHMMITSTPYSREIFYDARDRWETVEDPVERAYQWFIVNRMSFSGIGTSWSFGVSAGTRNRAQRPSAWLSSHGLIGWAHERLMRVQVEHRDFRDLLRLYDTSETLFYLDPPYVLDTRSSGACYDHEMTDDDHRDLVGMLLELQGKVLLSGYATPIYEPLEKAGWKRVETDVVCNAVGRTRAIKSKGAGGMAKHRRTEAVWISPNAQQAVAKPAGRKRRNVAPKFAQRIRGCPMKGVAA